MVLLVRQDHDRTTSFARPPQSNGTACASAEKRGEMSDVVSGIPGEPVRGPHPNAPHRAPRQVVASDDHFGVAQVGGVDEWQ
jgi:hypothetical protein